VRNFFRGHYRPSDEDLKKALFEGLIVLDANILLGLYRLPKERSIDVVNVLEKIKNRLWLPYQAALEFQRNRLNVVLEQKKRFNEVRDTLNNTQETLQSSFTKLQLAKRHPSIQVADFLKEFENILDKFRRELDVKEAEQSDVNDDDQLRVKLEEIFDGKIGNPPKDQNQLENWYKQGKERQELKIPPGYKDKGKTSKDTKVDSYVHNGNKYQSEYGDLVVWFQILEKIKEANTTHLVFVTDDTKEDWWLEKGGKTIGPRPELIEEAFSANANLLVFWMYPLEQFLGFISEQEGLGLKKETLSEVGQLIEKVEDHTGELEIINQDDLGYLDLVEEAEYSMAESTHYLLAITASMQDFTEGISGISGQMNDLGGSGKNVDSRAAKDLVNLGANQIDILTQRLEENTPLFWQAYQKGITAYKKAVREMGEIGQERKQQVAENLASLRVGIKTAIESVEGLLVSVNSIPKATLRLNESKRRISTALKILLQRFKEAEEMAQEENSQLAITPVVSNLGHP
jgi:PIN like domain